MKYFYTALLALILTGATTAQTYHNLAAGNFSQNWTNTGLITTNDNWSGVPSIIGYLGNNGNIPTGVDPQTMLSEGYSDTVSVFANQTAPNTFTNGGVAEFEITNPTIALNGSGTADAPNIVIYINSTGVSNIRIKYLLRDIDGSVDNAIQSVALQYRIGNTGDFINIPEGFVADASNANEATKETLVNLTLPSACNNQAELQIRIITSNAAGNDEWIGVDDIEVLKEDPTSVRTLSLDPESIRIAGNPAGSSFLVQFNKPFSSEVQVQILTLNGQVLQQQRLVRPAQGQSLNVPTAHLPKGAYILSIVSKEGRYTTKFIH